MDQKENETIKRKPLKNKKSERLKTRKRRISPRNEDVRLFLSKGRQLFLHVEARTALAIKACMERMHVLFTSVPHLITQIKECKSAKTLHQLEGRFKKYDLVVVTNSGMSHVTRRQESYSSTTSRLGLTPSPPSLRQTSPLIDGEKS